MNPLIYLFFYIDIIILHELGHILTYRALITTWPTITATPNWRTLMRIEIGDREEWANATKETKRHIIEAGVLVGIYGILLLFCILEDRWILLMLPLYLYQIRRDLGVLARI